MKRLSIAITLADNGGMTMLGPLAPTTASKNPSDHSKQRMYISPNLDPLTVGTNLLAMLADISMAGDKPAVVPASAITSDNIDIDIPF